MRGLPVTMASGHVTAITLETRSLTVNTGDGEVSGVKFLGGVPMIGDGVMVLVFGDRMLALTPTEDGGAPDTGEPDDYGREAFGVATSRMAGTGGTGLSAFQIYRLRGGDIETEDDWLASLQGPAGAPGEVDYDVIRTMIAEAMGEYVPPPPDAPPPPVVHVISNVAEDNLAGTYSGTGSKRTSDWDGRRGYYGYYSSTWGNQRSMLVLPAAFLAALRAVPPGAVTKAVLTFNNQHTFNATGTVKILLATETAIPGTLATVAGTTVKASQTVPKSGTVTVNIDAALLEELRSGGTGFKFTYTTTAQAGYGYLDLKSAKLTVTYEV
jgi:hypothetical protein